MKYSSAYTIGCSRNIIFVLMKMRRQGTECTTVLCTHTVWFNNSFIDLMGILVLYIHTFTLTHSVYDIITSHEAHLILPRNENQEEKRERKCNQNRCQRIYVNSEQLRENVSHSVPYHHSVEALSTSTQSYIIFGLVYGAHRHIHVYLIQIFNIKPR